MSLGTMDNVTAGSAGEQGGKIMEWKPSVELFCKSKPAWLEMEEMVGFYSKEGGPSESYMILS